jgi:hypothetical protein
MLLCIASTILQLGGTILLTLPLWKRAWAFDTSAGMPIDEKNRWPIYVRIGLGLLILGYMLQAWLQMNAALTAN